MGYSITTNFYELFLKMYPNYLLMQGEVNILLAILQLLPRLLEQSILSNFPCTLNGNGSRLVVFSYTNWDLHFYWFINFAA
jgi:hypothetical protein